MKEGRREEKGRKKEGKRKGKGREKEGKRRICPSDFSFTVNKICWPAPYPSRPSHKFKHGDQKTTRSKMGWGKRKKREGRERRRSKKGSKEKMKEARKEARKEEGRKKEKNSNKVIFLSL